MQRRKIGIRPTRIQVRRFQKFYLDGDSITEAALKAKLYIPKGNTITNEDRKRAGREGSKVLRYHQGIKKSYEEILRREGLTDEFLAKRLIALVGLKKERDHVAVRAIELVNKLLNHFPTSNVRVRFEDMVNSNSDLYKDQD